MHLKNRCGSQARFQARRDTAFETNRLPPDSAHEVACYMSRRVALAWTEPQEFCLTLAAKIQNRMPKQCFSTLHRPLPALKEDTALLHSFEILKSQQDPTSKQHRSDRSEGCKRSMRCSRIMQEFLNDYHDPRRTSCANYTCSNLCDLKLQACRARDDSG